MSVINSPPCAIILPIMETTPHPHPHPQAQGRGGARGVEPVEPSNLGLGTAALPNGEGEQGWGEGGAGDDDHDLWRKDKERCWPDPPQAPESPFPPPGAQLCLSVFPHLPLSLSVFLSLLYFLSPFSVT